MSEVMCFSNGRLHWDIQFRCPPQDWELESFDCFWVVLYSTNVWGVSDDKLCWKLAIRRGFEVRGFYHSLCPFVSTFSAQKSRFEKSQSKNSV